MDRKKVPWCLALLFTVAFSIVAYSSDNAKPVSVGPIFLEEERSGVDSINLTNRFISKSKIMNLAYLYTRLMYQSTDSFKDRNLYLALGERDGIYSMYNLNLHGQGRMVGKELGDKCIYLELKAASKNDFDKLVYENQRLL